MLIKYDNHKCAPKRAHPTDAGLDLVSTVSYVLTPGEQRLFDTGVSVQIPIEMMGLLVNRSSQGKKGIIIPHSVGVIDSDYRGNLMVILKNISEDLYMIDAFETRICQLIVVPIWIPKLNKFEGTEEEWVNTTRGIGGFGSTGA